MNLDISPEYLTYNGQRPNDGQAESRRRAEMKHKIDDIIAYFLDIVTLVILIAWFVVVLVTPFALVKLCWAFLTI